LIAEIASIVTYSDFKDLGACLRVLLPQIAATKFRMRTRIFNLHILQQQRTRERSLGFRSHPTARDVSNV